MEFFEKHLVLTLVLALLSTTCISASSWEKSGCHKVGHTRKIRIPGCVVFDITTNACRGFCQSYSTPSPEWILESNSKQSIWSVGQCCNIMETEDVLVEVMCLGGMKDLVFKSAKTCSCYHCKKE
ncbi:thyrostimulin alpha-2 subunit-like [Stegodyphus dumicola]|uniref:thyrostimulin alpha-2 subunit-like n=1 Tax=Stegodyphus dumicola TaxID=202533 RepID=UPI0015AC40D8|nr:thyrostimulin alpha-2 subunit-like [Stegodyphus dumicola]XP_035210034.1 thyrostimulin alpha-2 subunit-like [Stegodyphus dumicola]